MDDVTLLVERPVADSSIGECHSPPIIALVDTEAGFDALRDSWSALLSESSGRVFQTFEWLRTWWRHFGEGNPRLRLHIVVIWSEGRIIGIAPLHFERCRVVGPISYRLISFLGRETSDYLDVIALRGREEEVAECLAVHLAEVRDLYDVLLLEDGPGSSSMLSLLHGHLCDAGLSGEIFISDFCPRTTLKETWEATTKTFTSGHRGRLLKRFKAITETYGATFERVTNPVEICSAMDDFINIHQERWATVGYPGAFHDPRLPAFHGDVAPLLARRGWAYVAFLTVEGRRLVADYGFTFGGETSTYLGGAVGEKKFRALAPGMALRMYLIKDAILRGDRVFDFMRGAEQYKYGLGAIDVCNWSLIMYSRADRGVRWKRRVALLRRSLLRRVSLEMALAKHQALNSRIFSLTFFTYVLGRVRVVVADSLQKARRPEQSLVISRDQNREVPS